MTSRALTSIWQARCLLGLLLMGLIGLAGCDGGRIDETSGDLTPDRSAIAFGDVLVGREPSVEIHLGNAARSTVPATVLAVPASFTASPRRSEVPAGGEAILVVGFDPASSGGRSGTLVLADGRGAQVRISLSGTGIERAVEVPSVVDFGTVRMGERATRQLPVASLTDEPLEIALGLSGVGFEVAETSLALPARADAVLEVAFAPQQLGSTRASLSLGLCPRCAPVSVELFGNGAPAALSPRPERIDFLDVPAGAWRTRTLEVVNLSGSHAHLSRAALSPGGPSFSVDASALPLAIAPGASARLQATFAPREIGEHRASLQLFGCDDRLLFEVPLTGTCALGKLTANPSRIDFGARAVGAPATRRIVLAAASAAEPVVVTGVRSTGLGEGTLYVSASQTLPFAVDERELWMSVTFTPQHEGVFEGELVVETSDPEQPELLVPMTASAVAALPCELRLDPGEMRFGLVHAGSRMTRQIDLLNAGEGACEVSGLGLDPEGSRLFSLPSPPADRLSIAPGEAFPLEVAFEPAELTGRMESTSLRFQTDPGASRRSVLVTGMASGMDLVAEPAPIDFGRVAVGATVRRSFLLRNRGTEEVLIDQAGMAASSSDRFTLLSPSSGTLLPDQPISGLLELRPLMLGRQRGQVELWLTGEPEAFLIDALGEGAGQPCDEPCVQGPVAICPQGQQALVGSQARLAGSGLSPSDAPLYCSWRAIRAPTGSRAAPVAPMGECVASFKPDLVGSYELELTVADPAGRADRCVTGVEAQAPGGLWVELIWDLPSDLDLHLLHPNAGPAHERSSWSRPPHDCYFGNPNPSWDQAGPRDDPSLDRDDVAFRGSENIRILEPTPDQPYTVGIHWFKNHFNHPSLEASLNLYCAGRLVSATRHELTEVGTLVVVGEVEFQGSSSCDFRPDGTMLPP